MLGAPKKGEALFEDLAFSSVPSRRFIAAMASTQDAPPVLIFLSNSIVFLPKSITPARS